MKTTTHLFPRTDDFYTSLALCEDWEDALCTLLDIEAATTRLDDRRQTLVRMKARDIPTSVLLQ